MVIKNRVKTGKILSQIFWNEEKDLYPEGRGKEIIPASRICAEFMTEHNILKENVIYINQEGNRLTLIYEEVLRLEDPRIKLYREYREKQKEEQNG